jgi:hypothetical protein
MRIHRSGVWTSLLGLGVLVLASCEATPLLPEPESSVEPCAAALIEGTLVVGADGGLAIRESHTGRVRRVIWHRDHRIGEEGGRLALRDVDGALLAREGDDVGIGGGEGPEPMTWNACPGPVIVVGER